MSTKRTKRTRAGARTRASEPHSRIEACYSGCMLGFSLSVTHFRQYRKEYGTHRDRVHRYLAGIGAKVRLPERHRDFVANHDAIVNAIHAELGRVSRPALGWTLFGSTAIEFALKHAFRSPEARTLRRAAAMFLDKMELPSDVLTTLARASRREKDNTLSLYKLHSAALAMLNEIIRAMKREPRTAFIAMPFSVPRMRSYYARLYVPLVEGLECRPLRAWGGFGTEDYQELLYTLIDHCGVMMADLTTLNPNVMHEIGYAIGKGDKFIVLIADKRQPVLPNLGDLTVLTYQVKGRQWQAGAAGEIAAAVALFRYAADTAAPRRRSRRLVGPMKVTD